MAEADVHIRVAEAKVVNRLLKQAQTFALGKWLEWVQHSQTCVDSKQYSSPSARVSESKSCLSPFSTPKPWLSGYSSARSSILSSQFTEMKDEKTEECEVVTGCIEAACCNSLAVNRKLDLVALDHMECRKTKSAEQAVRRMQKMKLGSAFAKFKEVTVSSRESDTCISA